MSLLPAGVRRFFRLGRATDVEAEIDTELAFHFAQKVEALVARGMSADAAREEANRQFGDLRAAREELLRVDRGDAEARRRRDWFGDWAVDARHAVRGLRRTPGMTATIVVLLALGIGANAAMLGMLDRLLLRAPPHLADPDRLARIAITTQRPGRPAYARTLASFIDVEDYARGVPALTVAGYAHPRPAKIGDSDEELSRSLVTGRFFEVLGAPPALGRTLTTSDGQGPPVAVISDRFWRRYFGGAPSALGATVAIGRVVYTVIGVMPLGFSGAEVNVADAWTLMEHDAGYLSDWRTTRNTVWLEIIGRLNGPAARAAAIAQIEVVRRTYLATVGRADVTETAALLSIIPGRNSTFDRAGVRLAVAVGVVSALLLLLAIANVTNLLLVRAVARLREYAVRAALGAGRGRLMRFIVTESLLLATAGGAAAGLVAFWAGRALRSLILPEWHWATPPLGLLPALFAAGTALLIGIGTGLVPGVLAARESALGALRSGVQRGRGARGRVRSALVAVQVAVSVVLVAATGLFVRSLHRALHEDHGISVQQMLIAEVSFDGSGDARIAQLGEVLDAVRRVPGVAAATVTSAAPMRRLDFSTLLVDGRDTTLFGMSYTVAADFLERSRLRLMSGRGFTPRDLPGSERVALVDSVLAARFWPGQSPLALCLYVQKRDAGCARVVGVVAHTRANGLQEQPVPQFYLPLAQHADRADYALLIWSSGSAETLIEPVWRAVGRHITNYPRSRVLNFDTMLEPQVRSWRVGTILLSIAAGLALLLSSVGTFAVMAFSIRQRAHEFGVRRALGAQARHVVGLVLGEGVGVAGAGVVLGLVAAVASSRFAAPLLYGTQPRDPLVLAGASASLLVAAVAAALGAARIALRTDPRQALQAD